ncbi:MAG: hypothetical protein E7175_03755 [Erysipelotrichaceae bacterium]|nr:hypothetical protein [Erysipelotrichaceae bacterium]
MPKKYQPLTKEEKQALLKKHQEYVDKFNDIISQDVSRSSLAAQSGDQPVPYLEFDNSLFEKMDNEEEVAVYRLANEIKDIHNRQQEILTELTQAHGPVVNNDASFLVAKAFKTDDTAYARAYNKRLYQEFQSNPNKVIAMLYKKVLNYDPKQLASVGDDKKAILEYYKNNHEIIDLADSVEQFRRSAAMINQNDEFAMAFDNDLREPLKIIAYPARLARVAGDPEHFAFPDLYKEQAEAIKNYNDNNPQNYSEALNQYILDSVDETNATTYMPKNYFTNIEEAKGKVNSKFLTTQVLYEENHQGPELGINYTFKDLCNVFRDEDLVLKVGTKNGPGPFRLRCVNRVGEETYLSLWRKEVNRGRGRQGDFDYHTVRGQLKGGIWERYIRRNTSQQWKDFINAFEEYNNPKANGYLDKQALRENAEYYLTHKGVHSREDLANLSGTALARATMCLATKEALDKEAQLEAQADRELSSFLPVYKEPFLDEEEVAVDNHNNNNIIENELNNNIENNIENEIKNQ